MKAIIFGAPGSGKGTYASRLQAKLNINVIVMGDIFREILKQNTDLGRKVKGYVEKGMLVPDDIVVQTLKNRLAELPADRGFIMDGYPRTLEQAKILETITPIDVILLLDVPDWIIIERSSTRRICKNCGTIFNIRFLKPKVEGICDKCGGELYQRSDDTPEVIKKRLQVYKDQTMPILEHFKQKNIPIITFRATSLETPPDTVVEQMMSELKKAKLI
ncbi:MAG: nucleoside monophosphate kinase [Candidatus Bathyarchaeota archaeon]|nr:nucleoside monophosphate kinase [Candidatus Bathyarchaeota archaeon]